MHMYCIITVTTHVYTHKTTNASKHSNAHVSYSNLATHLHIPPPAHTENNENECAFVVENATENNKNEVGLEE